MSHRYTVPRVMIPELDVYLTAEQAYVAARSLVIARLAPIVETWSREGLNEYQILAQLRLYQVPEDLLTPITDAARHSEAPVRP